MARSDSQGWARFALLVAGLTWFAVAVWGFVHLQDLAAQGLLWQPFELLGGEGLTALLFAMPLVVGWLLVLGSIGSTAWARTWGAALTLGLSAGGLAIALVILAQQVPPLGPLVPGPGDVLAPFVVVALLPQLLALAAGARLVRAARAGAPQRSRRLLALGVGAALVSLASNAVLGLASFRRCQVAASAAMSDLMTVLSAEDAYQSDSGGRYTSIACLLTPRDCPGIAGHGLPELGEKWLKPVRCGYRFTFYPGRPAPGSSAPEYEMESFAVTAVPLGPRLGDGMCADSSFVIRGSPDGRVPPPTDGHCSEELAILR